MITDAIYKFNYLNLQGQSVELTFVPNVCNINNPAEIHLVENVFAVKSFAFSFAGESIKDRVCGAVPSILEVDVNFKKLNRLAMEDEHYMNILECLLNYKNVYERIGQFKETYNIYNVFIVDIGGVSLFPTFLSVAIFT